MKDNRISRQPDEYLDFKHSLGFKLTHEESVLRNFANYTLDIGYSGSLNVEIVLSWIASGSKKDKTMARKLGAILLHPKKGKYNHDQSNHTNRNILCRSIHKHTLQFCRNASCTRLLTDYSIHAFQKYNRSRKHKRTACILLTEIKMRSTIWKNCHIILI